MAPLANPWIHPSGKTELWDDWSSIAATKPVARLQRAQNNIRGRHQPGMMIRDSDSLRPSELTRAGYNPALGIRGTTGLPGESPPTQTTTSHGMTTPRPTSGIPSATRTPRTQLTSQVGWSLRKRYSSLDKATSAPPTGFLRPARSGGVLASKVVTTTFVTPDFFTTHIATTSTLSNGHKERLTIASSGTRGVTTTATIFAQITSVSPSVEPPKGKTGTQGRAIGGAIGATILVISSLFVFFVLRHKCRKLVNSGSNLAASEPQPPQAPRITQIPNPILPRPFLALSTASQDNVAISRQEKREKILSSLSRPQHNQEPNAGDHGDPFQDPEAPSEDIPEQEVQGARNALGRLQQLTSQLEAELLQLGGLTRSAQLSGDERTRLEEIRRTTGLTMPFDQRDSHLSVVGGETNCSAVPPSYHSEWAYS